MCLLPGMMMAKAVHPEFLLTCEEKSDNRSHLHFYAPHFDFMQNMTSVSESNQTLHEWNMLDVKLRTLKQLTKKTRMQFGRRSMVL